MLLDYPGMSCSASGSTGPRASGICGKIEPTSSSTPRSSRTTCRTRPTSGTGRRHQAQRSSFWGRRNCRGSSTATFPGDGVRTDDEILHWARQYGGTVWHLIGTCRMGPATDESSVVSDGSRSMVCRTCA